MNASLNNRFSRRQLLQAGLPAAIVLAGASRPAPGAGQGESRRELPPVRAITRGPKHHWFGYYDKAEFDPQCRYVLGMEVDFEHRAPTPDDEIRVGMVDLHANDAWIELGRCRAWGWQQGCMLQWRPGTAGEVLWNDREDGRFVCHLLDVRTGRKRTIPQPIYTLSPDGRWAAAPDFARLNDVRPGYGYAGPLDPFREVLAPKDSGVWRIDLPSGHRDLTVSLAELAKVPYPKGDLSGAKHWFNHLLVNPDGTRLEFLHRWRSPGQAGFSTRMCTVAPDGSGLRIIDHSGQTSHFIWRDPEHILAWSWHPSHGPAFYLFEDRQGGKVEVVGKGAMSQNGHCSYLPGNDWVLNDTYPDRKRNQHVYLYHVATGRKVPLGSFQSPRQYEGQWRCDTHPRFSPDRRWVAIDSPHGGQGRQLCLIDLGGLLG